MPRDFTEPNMEKLQQLPTDIFNLFDPENNHVVNEENLNAFADNLKDILRNRLATQERRTSPLRFSSLGKPDRQLWFDAHPDPVNEETMPPKTYMKFLYGDIIEQLLLFLTKEAGHSVEDEQGKVEVNGVTGSLDAIIDGIVVDVKSASSYGYKKFEAGTVEQDDPFGYVAQLSGYASVKTPGVPAAWLANDKVAGDICVSPLSAITIKHYQPAERIDHLKGVIERDTPPALCHTPVPDGKSGNMMLPTPCSYCKHKKRCHPNLRTFIYSTGPRYLTVVANLPKVYEVTNGS